MSGRKRRRGAKDQTSGATRDTRDVQKYGNPLGDNRGMHGRRDVRRL